ncbi:MAG: hypothetical protein AB7O97_01730 [Planctomycetota bacterium]
MTLLWAQVVLAFAAGAEPVRFGAPVPERVLQAGLSVRGGGEVHWRPLPLATRDGLSWVEVAVVGAGDHVRLQLGGAPARPTHAGATRSGPVVTVSRTSEPALAPADRTGDRAGDRADDRAGTAPPIVGSCQRTEWRWGDGSIDRRERTVFRVATTVQGESFEPGEAWTRDGPGLERRGRPLTGLPRALWVRTGLLPRDRGLAAPVRAHLQRAAAALSELPGMRGRGDYGRSGDVITNLEFDTTLALLRLGLALGDDDLLLRARRAAWHLCDRDLDAATGLPFGHGPDHRHTPPAPGHAWLQGLLWVGALWADDELLAAARQIAHGLASVPPMGEGVEDRARDYGWPLLELEACLRLLDDPRLARAADALAAAIARRYRPELHVFAFGEGEAGRGPGYFERAWVTGGVLLPALRAHLERRPDRALRAMVDDVTRALTARIGQGRGGLPTHWRVVPGAVFAEHRAVCDPKAFLLLEALGPRELQRLLRRPEALDGLLGTPVLDDPDLATSLTMAARCDWVYR